MKRAIRNFIIELICYVVVLAILVVVVGLLLGWSLEMIITQVITFSFGWAVVKIIAILLEMRDRKEDNLILATRRIISCVFLNMGVFMDIINAKIFTMNDEDTIIENGYIKIKDGKIFEVGDMLSYSPSGDEL